MLIARRARTCLSWKFTEKADKDRFFKEPGFVFGCSVCRPKVYRQNQSSGVVGILDDSYGWLDARLWNDPQFSWDKRTATSAPLILNTDAYWVDRRDIFLYGDQFVNFALTETDANLISTPTAALKKRYAATADADELFVSASPLNQLRQDGTVFLNILGNQIDASPR